MDSKLFYIINVYLKKLKIYIDKEELKFQLLSHPSYPSLHSATGVLDHFNIDNVALEVPTTVDVLNQCPEIFITLITISGSKEYTVVKKKPNSFECIVSDKQTIHLNTDEFLKQWTGIVIVVEPNNSENSNNVSFINAIKKYLVLFVVASFIGLFLFKKPTAFDSTYFILSLTGVAISIAIIRHELGFYSKIVEKFCISNNGSNCDNVLNSKGATFYEFIKLSDISLVYFIGICSSLIIFSDGIVTSTLSFLSFLTVPVIIYSLYYQSKIVKSWCALCLGILGVLLLQLATVFIFHTPNSFLTIDIATVLMLVLNFLITASVWIFLRPLLKNQQELLKLQIDHFKFKRNFGLFEAALNKSQAIDTSINVNEVILGDSNAALNLILITNPLCGYCRTAHSDIEMILRKHATNVNVVIRFNVSVADTLSTAYKVSGTLLALYDILPVEKFLEELGVVYSNDFIADKWLSKWNHLNINTYDSVLKKEQEWCHSHQINFTPELLINGKAFPKEYDRTDLSYFIEELIECHSNTLNKDVSPMEVSHK